MATNYISSKQLIHEIINDYNIQGMDFIPRVSEWVMNGLREIDSYKNYVQYKATGVFGITDISEHNGIVQFNRDDVYGFELPINCDFILQLKLNNIIAYDKGTVRPRLGYNAIEDKTITLYNPDEDINNYFFNGAYTLDTGCKLKDTSEYYSINNNFVHTSVANGTYELLYRGVGLEYDNFTESYYPLILDNAILKKALKLYILKMILMRGYVHPILSLTSNNYLINPALEFDQIRVRARVACDKFTFDERYNLSDTLINN